MAKRECSCISDKTNFNLQTSPSEIEQVINFDQQLDLLVNESTKVCPPEWKIYYLLFQGSANVQEDKKAPRKRNLFLVPMWCRKNKSMGGV